MMILHMHDDKTQGGEQLPSPVSEKQTGAPLEEQQPEIPTRPQRSRQWLLRIFGIVLPFAGGFLIGWPNMYEPETNVLYSIMICGVVALSVVVGAALLRSWWAIEIVPVACIAGGILARYIVSPLVQGWYCGNIPGITCPASGWYSPGWSAVQAYFETGVMWRELSTLWPVILLLIFLATFGAKNVVFNRGSLSNWLQNRRQQR